MVNVMLNDGFKGIWLFTTLYVGPVTNIRQKRWEALKDINIDLNSFP